MVVCPCFLLNWLEYKTLSLINKAYDMAAAAYVSLESLL